MTHQFRREQFLGCRLLFAAALILALPLVARAEQGDTLHILFIGNSYTYTNELPAMVAGLAESAGRAAFVDESTVGGFTLEQHLHYQPSIDKIHERRWEVVVLQEQSMLPTIPYYRDHSMYPASRQLDSIIRSVGAKTMFFLTWGRKKGGEQAFGSYASPAFRDFFEMQDSLTAAYGRIARELSADLCPVGLAWKLEYRANPNAQLWDSDGSHPTAEGTYLGACTFFSMLFRSNPEGASYSETLSPTVVAGYQKLGHDAVLMYGELTPPFKLWQNYPNPFARFTTFTFSVSRPGNVSLRLYAATGAQVATVVSGQKNVGTYDVLFDGRVLSSGAYFCRMQSEGFSETKKALLFK